MPDQPTAFALSLTLLMAAAVVLYVGTRLLWAAVASPGLWRGVVMAGPVLALAMLHAPGSPATAIAMLVSAALLVLTLGLGVSTIDLPVDEADGSPILRSLPPLAATVCLAGFHGELGWPHAAALAVVGGLTLWTAAGERRTPPGNALRWAVVPSFILIGGGLTLLLTATHYFNRANGSGALTPVVVLLTVPAVLLAMLGLLSAEAREHRPDTPQETAAGLAIACLGAGLPAVIIVGHAVPLLAKRLPAMARFATTQPAFAPATRPVTVWPSVVMPLSTWRVDSVLLVIVSILLLPIGTGRFKLGRVEGVGLIVLYLAYAAVATRTGARSG